MEFGVKRTAALALLALALTACGKSNSSNKEDDTDSGDDSGDPDAVTPPTFTFGTNIFAAGLTALPATGLALSEDGEASKTNIFTVDATGKRTPAGENVYAGKIVDARAGLLLDLSVVTTQCVGGCVVLAKRDNTFHRLGGGSDHYVGENLQGDLIFKDATKLPLGSTETTPLVSDWTLGEITHMSGNFVRAYQLGGSGEPRLLNTATGKSFALQDCGGTIAAITETLVYADDCSDKEILNTETGERIDIDDVIRSATYPVHSQDRMVTLAQHQPAPGEDLVWTLAIVNKDLVLSVLDDVVIDPDLTSSSYVLDTDNGFLFASKDYVVVKETSQVSLVDIEAKTKQAIFEGISVASISMNDHAVYFTGTDGSGQKISGQYTYEDGKTSIYEGETTFDAIEAVNRF